jgi:hypothetical protein
MLFWTILIVGIATLIISFVAYEYWDAEFLSGVSGVVSGIALFTAFIMLLVLIFSHVGVQANVDRMETRYDMLTYQYENNIYDNDNDLGYRDLVTDIQEWNEDLSYKKAVQKDLWLGIFYPNIYDQFEFIELAKGG